MPKMTSVKRDGKRYARKDHGNIEFVSVSRNFKLGDVPGDANSRVTLVTLFLPAEDGRMYCLEFTPEEIVDLARRLVS